ncbi:MAG: RNA polymerase sigma factor [Lachnospiraceae bacterium]|nr:RNA polymerase sigma factor [Lachnospiraceae bacterium]
MNTKGGNALVQIDKWKFVELIEVHKSGMYRLAVSILRNSTEAEDAVGEAIIKAYEKLDKLKDADKFKAWIMQIVVHEAQNIYRTKKHFQYVEDLELTGASYQDEHLELLELVLELPEEFRSVVVLFYYEGFSQKEIAGILQTPEGTVKSRLFRARKILQEKL